MAERSMWTTSANAILPSSSWLKEPSDTSPSTEQKRSRAQQTLVSIWRTVGGLALTKRDSEHQDNINTSLDLESPLTEADLREYEKIDSPRAPTPSTCTPRSPATNLPILSPRFSPREFYEGNNRHSPREGRVTYTPKSAERRRSRDRTPSPLRPNYTKASCRAVDRNYVDSVVRDAQTLCDSLLETEEAEEYVELHASVNNAYEETATTLHLARTSLQQNWGAVFYVPSQLKMIGWRSKQYLVIDNLTPCAIDGGPSPAMIGGVKVGDVVIGVNGGEITSNTQFVDAIKRELMITLEVVRPDELEEITDEQFEDEQEQLLKEVLAQANQNAVDTLARMRRLDSRQKRVFLEKCV